jgi:predicted ATP-grasp superfamily ATP-dependent carboligase
MLHAAWRSPGGPLDVSVPVVVLKMHHGSLGIARSLGRLGVAVYGVAVSRDAPAWSSRYWRERFEWPLETAPAQRTLDYLLELGRSLGNRALLIPVSDRTTLFVAEHADALGEQFRFPLVSRATAEGLVSKKEMYLLARRFGIPTAHTEFPRSRADVADYAARGRFPVAIKGIDGTRMKARVGCTVWIARTPSELLAQYERMEDPEQPNLMLQEYIPGGEDSVWMFNGYFNAESECLAGFTGKKIRQNPVYTGSTSLGICLRNDEVARLTRRFMKAVAYRGILDIGYRYDARDRTYKVLDVNPRIGATFRLFVDANGLDVARVFYRDMTGQPVPATVHVEGRKWIVENHDVESSYRYWRDGKLAFAQWLASFRGVREGAWFAWDDLRPFRAMGREFLASATRSGARKLLVPLRKAVSP